MFPQSVLLLFFLILLLPIVSLLFSIVVFAQDKDWQVLKLVLEKLPLTLQNKTLVLTGNPDIDEFCKNLCAMVSLAACVRKIK